MTLQTSNRKEIQLTKCLPEIEVTLEAGLGSSPHTFISDRGDRDRDRDRDRSGRGRRTSK